MSQYHKRYCEDCDDGLKRSKDPVTGLWYHPPQTVCLKQKLPGEK